MPLKSLLQMRIRAVHVGAGTEQVLYLNAERAALGVLNHAVFELMIDHAGNPLFRPWVSD